MRLQLKSRFSDTICLSQGLHINRYGASFEAQGWATLTPVLLPSCKNTSGLFWLQWQVMCTPLKLMWLTALVAANMQNMATRCWPLGRGLGASIFIRVCVCLSHLSSVSGLLSAPPRRFHVIINFGVMAGSTLHGNNSREETCSIRFPKKYFFLIGVFWKRKNGKGINAPFSLFPSLLVRMGTNWAEIHDFQCWALEGKVYIIWGYPISTFVVKFRFLQFELGNNVHPFSLASICKVRLLQRKLIVS